MTNSLSDSYNDIIATVLYPTVNCLFPLKPSQPPKITKMRIENKICTRTERAYVIIGRKNKKKIKLDADRT